MKELSHRMGAYVVCDCGQHVDIRFKTVHKQNAHKTEPCWTCRRRVTLELRGGKLIGLVENLHTGQMVEVGRETDRNVQKPRLIVNYHTWE